MPSSSPKEVTELLRDWSAGSQQALSQLMPLVYDELRRLAGSYLRKESSRDTLEATGLVHEAFFRLVDQKEVSWQNRAHFFGIAAQSMRRVLLDYARKRATSKRGGAEVKVTLSEAVAEEGQRDLDLIGLDAALDGLSEMDPQQGRIVELRYFGGLTIEECAEVLSISPATVKRDWGVARAWLHRELKKQ